MLSDAGCGRDVGEQSDTAAADGPGQVCLYTGYEDPVCFTCKYISDELGILFMMEYFLFSIFCMLFTA